MFIIMIRNKCVQWIFCVHMFNDNENDDIITIFFIQIKKWCKNNWHLRYFFTDDFAVEQRIVFLIFRNLIIDEQMINHFFCKKHLKRIFDRIFASSNCKIVKQHFYSILYFRQTSMNCEQSIEIALKIASKLKKIISNENDEIFDDNEFIMQSNIHVFFCNAWLLILLNHDTKL